MTWEIDTSTGTPILVYEKCSVIQDEQAHQALRAVKNVERYRKSIFEAIKRCHEPGVTVNRIESVLTEAILR